MADKATNALKDRLAQRKQMTEEVRTQGELDTLPQNQGEATLMQMEATLGQMLPGTMDKQQAAKLVHRTIQLIRTTPKLAECGNTIMGGVLTAAQLGLELGVNALGEAYLLPMRNWKTKRSEATLIIGYKGYRKLAWQSGVIKEISREIVYAKDVFRVQYGTNRGLVHIPSEDEDRGPVKGYYAVVTLTNGGHMFDYMTLPEVQAHRDAYAMARKSGGEIVGPWKDNFNEMALKTVLLRALRDAPQSIEDRLTLAMRLDGSVRDTVSEVTDHGELLNSADLTHAFANTAGELTTPTDQVPPPPERTGRTKPLDPQQYPPQDAPAAEPTDRQFIETWCQANGEDPLDTIVSVTGVSYSDLNDYSEAELAEAAQALREHNAG